MIYTCYEMIGDCRAGRAEGWRYFVSQYVPVVRRILAHYGAGMDERAVIKQLLLTLRRPDSTLFQSMEPAPERWFVAELRQRVLAQLSPPESSSAIDLQSLGAALEPLTMVEKQAVWLETMRYPAAQTGAMLRMAPATAEKIRAKGAELLRGSLDSWSRNILEENGRALGLAASAASTQECLPPKPFLDLLDGRTTWEGRDELERHVLHCWHCIDHFCRLVEVIELLRGLQPLSDADAAPYWELLAVAPARRPAWKRWLTGRA